MGREKIRVGAAGEDIARRYLLNKGYKVIGKNIRTPFGEIDLVARHKGLMVFIEVKSRLTHSLGPPFLSVTKLKERHIIKNALFYLKKHGLFWSDWRIDVVSVKLNEHCQAEHIEHFENAVEDSYGYR